MGLHPSHKTRVGDASSWDEICVKCGHTDISGGGWGLLAEPCSKADSLEEPWAIDWKKAAEPKANAYQVGGDHYKTSYEHWDLVVDTGMGYFEGNATKYLSRWRNKGGSADLKKALHYVTKLIEVSGTLVWQRNLLLDDTRLAWIKGKIDSFGLIHNLTITEVSAIRKLATWKTDADLELAKQEVVTLIAAYPEAVPLTEENHHSPRVGDMYAEG